MSKPTEVHLNKERVTESPAIACAKPLYRHVHDQLVARLAEGVWQPGQLIPSEFQIADELGVSQGTVRKALDLMTAERLLTRQQGRGTFVAEVNDAHILFHFFNLAPDSGAAAFPTAKILSVGEGTATTTERERLALTPLARVIRIKESRGTRFAILEGGINHLLRPLLTGEPFPVRAIGKSGPMIHTTLAGPLCTSLDRLGEVDLPVDLAPGDLLSLGLAWRRGQSLEEPHGA